MGSAHSFPTPTRSITAGARRLEFRPGPCCKWAAIRAANHWGFIRGSPAWTLGSVLLITWDEDDHSADNNVLTLVVRPGGHHAVSRRPYDHYSLLATVEDLLGVPRLGRAAQAAAMTDLLNA